MNVSGRFAHRCEPTDLASPALQFFLRGTQLAQLTEEYEQIRSNTETMDEALTRKREIVPELKDAYRKAKDRAKSAQLAWDQKQSLGPLRDQLAWACVDEIEEVRTSQALSPPATNFTCP